MELKLVEHRKREILTEDKVQIQVKNKQYSRSLTAHGTNVDFVYNQIFMMMDALARSPQNRVMIVCYKPPVEVKNDISNVDGHRQGRAKKAVRRA